MRKIPSLFVLMAAASASAQEYVDLDLPSGTLWATYIFIKNNNQVFYQDVRPSYEKRMIRAVRKQKKPTAVKPAWAETSPARPVYQQGHIIIWSDGTKTLNRK